MVSRTIDPTLLAEISKPFFFPVFLVWIDWPEDPVFAHSGVGDIGFDSETWTGVAGLASVSLPQEGNGITVQTASFSLIGLPATLAALVASAPRDMDCAVWFGAVTERAGNTLVGEPFEAFRGISDELREMIQMTEGDVMRSADLMARTGPSKRAVAGVFHTNESHQLEHPGDTLFRHAAGVEDSWRRGVAVDV